MQKVPYRIVNIVASIFLNHNLDLKSIHENLEHTTYNPKRYHAVVYRPPDITSTILIVKSGTIIFTGGKNMQDIQMAKNKIIDKFNKLNIVVNVDLPIKIINMVGVADLIMEIDLIKTVVSLGLERAEYEPENFPSIIYKFPSSKMALLIFRSGKLILSGAKSEDELQNGFNEAYNILNLY